MLCVVAVTRTVSGIGSLGGAGVGLYLSGGRHDEDVAKVRVACAAQVCVAEAHDGLVAVLIAGAVLVDLALVAAIHVVRDGVRLGTELDDAEGCAGSGEGVSHAVRADDGVDVVDGPPRSLLGVCL